MQLVAYGSQDVYLTGNPQITFWKVVYRRHINFALAKAYEDLGDVGLAYKHYLEGNALRKRELQYEPATEEVFFNCLKNTFRDLQKIKLRLPQTDISPVPIFVLGMLLHRPYSRQQYCP